MSVLPMPVKAQKNGHRCLSRRHVLPMVSWRVPLIGDERPPRVTPEWSPRQSMRMDATLATAHAFRAESHPGLQSEGGGLRRPRCLAAMRPSRLACVCSVCACVCVCVCARRCVCVCAVYETFGFAQLKASRIERAECDRCRRTVTSRAGVSREALRPQMHPAAMFSGIWYRIWRTVGTTAHQHFVIGRPLCRGCAAMACHGVLHAFCCWRYVTAACASTFDRVTS